MNHHSQQQNQPPQSNMQMGSGLTRYRSAPSSYFSSLLDSSGNVFGTDDFEQLFNPRASSPETHLIFSRFMNSSDQTIQENCSSNVSMEQQSQSQQTHFNPQFLEPTRNESEVVQKTQTQQLQRQPSNDYPSVSHMMYENHNNPEPTTSAVGNSYDTVVSSMNSNRIGQMKMGSGSGLIRHSSSPAGLFANIDIEREFGATMRGIGSFGRGNSSNAETSFPSSRRHKRAMEFSSSSSGMMPSISEIQTKGVGQNSQFDEDRVVDPDYIQGYPVDSWDDSAILSDNFLDGFADSDTKPFANLNAPDHQNAGGTSLLSHQLSLPTSTAEVSALEKLLQESVPCRTRAKRGCATHPRSIAERMRRTKISQRMRKLQELVPNMEKQTNTADMLDLAVDYIKDLQEEVKKLSDDRARCCCSAEQQL